MNLGLSRYQKNFCIDLENRKDVVKNICDNIKGNELNCSYTERGCLFPTKKRMTETGRFLLMLSGGGGEVQLVSLEDLSY